jgi:hypothetical protein
MNNDNFLLPTGDYLRQLIGQSTVKASDLKQLARQRGIFSIADDKKIIGPFLIKTGISPYEFVELKEQNVSKEESPKYKTRSIEWLTEKPLIEALPDFIDFESILDRQFETCELVSEPTFIAQAGNPNYVSMEFEISRKDLTRNWGENTTNHKGRVELKRVSGSSQVLISLTHTANETKDFANKIVEKALEHFKASGDISTTSVILSIRFGDFSNQNRIKFLNELSQKCGNGKLTFSDTKDIRVSPADLSGAAPNELIWMKDRIDELKLKGKDLHSTFFINDTSFHQYIQLFGITCEYKFSCSGFAGECRILFDFSEADANAAGSELTLNIAMIKLDINDSGASKDTAKKELLESIEEMKIELYQKYRYPTLAVD